MDILIQALQLLLSLSILVVLHELGHFIPAKIFKTRVEKFYLFFDPWFSIIKKKIGDTEYGVGWLPLGGYVKISGMIDESMDTEQMKKPAQHWEFRSKPAWQRLIIMLGGVIVNLLLGIFIYSMTLYAYGEKYLPNKNLTDGVWCVGDLATELGFKTGDVFLSADGEEIDRFSDVLEKVVLSEKILIERDGIKTTINMPVNVVDRLLENKKQLLFYPRVPCVVGSVVKGSVADKAGIQKKDLIVSIDNNDIKYYDEVRGVLQKHKNKKVSVLVSREKGMVELLAQVGNDGVLGFSSEIPSLKDLDRLGCYSFSSNEYGFFASLPAGYKKAIKKLGSYIDQFMLILNPDSGAYKGMGGFGAIGSLFPPSWNWEMFWNLTAFLSLMLAFMNILPIPALDGGHVLFLIYEIVVGKPAPQKVMEIAQTVGVVVLLSLLVFANGNDILRLF